MRSATHAGLPDDVIGRGAPKKQRQVGSTVPQTGSEPLTTLQLFEASLVHRQLDEPWPAGTLGLRWTVQFSQLSSQSTSTQSPAPSGTSIPMAMPDQPALSAVDE